MCVMETNSDESREPGRLYSQRQEGEGKGEGKGGGGEGGERGSRKTNNLFTKYDHPKPFNGIPDSYDCNS